MRSLPTPVLDARWPAVYRLVERWASLPVAQWRLLIDAEQVIGVDARPDAPRNYTQWMIRDLVQTAWWMAARGERAPEAPWMPDARAALERAALRLIEPRNETPTASLSVAATARRLHQG